MATIMIKGHQHEYSDSDVITFAEGLIGLPRIRRAVVLSMNEFEPFCWLAPLDETETRFVVVDPKLIFDNYQPKFHSSASMDVQTYAIVTIASDWKQTTINLRAPILINPEERTGSQQILTETQYHFAERLPQD